MFRLDPYEKNYARLAELLGQPPESLQPERVYRLRAKGFMDLVVERLWDDEEYGVPVLSLVHYYQQNGDACRDPEMTVRVFAPKGDAPGMVEVLSFEQSIPFIYQVVYLEPGKYIPRLKRELNAFLVTWLRNLKQQGHRLVRAA